MTATQTPPAAEKPATAIERVKTIEDLLYAQPKTARITASVIEKVLRENDLKPDETVTEEQLRRASVAEATKGGLVGKARALWIVCGESSGATPARDASAKTSGRNARAGSRADAGSRGPREGSTMHSVLLILKDARKPMSPEEMYDEMKRRKLAGNLKGKTPVATIAAQCCVAVARRQHGLTRPEKGRYEVAK